MGFWCYYLSLKNFVMRKQKYIKSSNFEFLHKILNFSPLCPLPPWPVLSLSFFWILIKSINYLLWQMSIKYFNLATLINQSGILSSAGVKFETVFEDIPFYIIECWFFQFPTKLLYKMGSFHRYKILITRFTGWGTS